VPSNHVATTAVTTKSYGNESSPHATVERRVRRGGGQKIALSEVWNVMPVEEKELHGPSTRKVRGKPGQGRAADVD